MRDLKHLFIGLLIGAVLFVLIIGALLIITPESLPTEILLPNFPNTPTHTYTPSPSATLEAVTPPLITTSTPTLTAAPPTVTFTPTLSPGQIMQSNGGLTITGPLSPEQQIRLYDASLQFLAPSFSQAKKIGEQINGKGYGSPTLICGPLSIAILRDAGVLPEWIKPYDFWILNPDDAVAREKLKATFSPTKYTNTRIRTRIDQVDWKSQPLQPGDFIYIYAGNGGNFEHMLVVTRVDIFGRAYSVTNYETTSGFVIQEVLLYDPNVPDTGIFHQWTERQWALLGSTGYAGFEVWRLIPLQPTQLP